MEDGYSARGWLGIITAGALWVPLYEARRFDVGIDQLVQQIRHALPADGGRGEELSASRQSGVKRRASLESNVAPVWSQTSRQFGLGVAPVWSKVDVAPV